MSDSIVLPDTMGALFASARFYAFRDGFNVLVYRKMTKTKIDKSGTVSILVTFEKFYLHGWEPKAKIDQNVRTKIVLAIMDINQLSATPLRY